MNSDCHFLNPLQRDGTSQQQRMSEALDPTYAPVDERQLSDYLAYLTRYAALLQYYAPNNTRGGNWTPFVLQDVTTLAAAIAETEYQQRRAVFQRLQRRVGEHAGSDKVEALQDLFGPVLATASEIEAWYDLAVEETALRRALEEFICGELQPAREQLKALLAQAEGAGLSIPNVRVIESKAPCGTPGPVRLPSVFTTGVNDAELDAAADALAAIFEKYYEVLVQLVQSAPRHLRETLEQHSSHHPHMALLLTFLQLLEHARSHVNTLTERHLNFYYQEVLRLRHEPAVPDRAHVTFQLAQHASEHRIPEGTLLKAGKDATGVDLIYATEDELIANRAHIDAEAGLKSVYVDKVVSTAQLARLLNVERSEIEKVVQARLRTAVVPPRLRPETARAVAKELGTDLEAAGFIGEGGLGPHVVGNIYAAPDADSENGLGADLKSEDGKWETFGGPHMPTADVGFAIASPMLLLTEGERVVTLTFTFDELPDSFVQLPKMEAERQRDELLNGFVSIEILPRRLRVERSPFLATLLHFREEHPVKSWTETVQAELAHNVEVHFSGAEVWIPGEVTSVDIDEAAATMIFEMLIPPESPAVVPFQRNVLSGGFETRHPVVKFVLDNEGFSANQTGFDLELVEPQDPFQQGRDYERGDYVQYGSGVYVARRMVSEAEAPPDESGDWRKIGAVEAYDEQRTYGASASDYVWYEGELYRARKDDVRGLLPDRHPDVWEQICRSYPYKYFQPLKLKALEIGVDVTGITGLVMENEIGVVNPAKPFQPFGPQPRKGSRFYIGSTEVFHKNVDTLDLQITWGGLPEGESFHAHYAEYEKQPSGNGDFTASVRVLEDGAWKAPRLKGDGAATAVRLFTGEPSPDPERSISLEDVLNRREPEMEPVDGFRTTLRRGFLRLELNRGFLHRDYPKELAQAARDGGTMPNEPYTPLIEGLALSYSSSEQFDFERTTRRHFDRRTEQFFHIRLFGQAEFYPLDGVKLPDGVLAQRGLVPSFEGVVQVDERPARTTVEGSLMIGLRELDPPQNISLLFQVAEGSADPALGKPDVAWSYLADNEWTDFQREEIVRDRTNGLQTSGIITFAMPEAMTAANTVLPAGLHWIRASVATNSAGTARLIAVLPQAVRAVFRDQGNDPEHVRRGLAAGAITKLRDRRAAITSVAQPFASFGGRMSEQDPEYYTRVSERLRHKERAVTIFDYERLVLERFPEVYKVQCINHTSDRSELDPGHVRIIVVPDLRNKNTVDPLRPRVSRNTLSEIGKYLGTHSTDFVRPEVKNPAYEQVRSNFRVKFQPGRDVGFHLKQLDGDIIRFLSPWLYEESEDLPFGGRVHRSWILNYAEEQPYVDYVTEFTLDHLTEEQVYRDVEEAAATSSSSVLVSAPSHQISHIE